MGLLYLIILPIRFVSLLFMLIHTKNAAKKLWKMFYQKYSHLGEILRSATKQSKIVSKFKQANFIDLISKKGLSATEIETKRQTLQNYKHKEDMHSKKEKTSNDHKKQMKKLSDSMRTKRLLAALEKGDWYNKIFADKAIKQLTLNLFATSKISYQQACSILDRLQYKEVKNVFIYAILDANGNFTKEAEEILLPWLKNIYFLSAPTSDEITEFKLLIGTLPQSERFFYCIHENSQITVPHKKPTNEYQKIRLTTGARDAWGIIHFGLDEYVPLESQHI